MIKNTPTHLMRFYGNVEYALQCIEEKKLALIRASKFNDPFDPPIFIITDAPHAIQNIEEMEGVFRKRLHDPTFIASFCEVSPKNQPKENLYMWGHYGGGHRGVALQFDFELLEKHLNYAEMHGKKVNVNLFPIEYQQPPVITLDDWRQFKKGNQLPFLSKFEKTLSCKTKNWETENEWRYVQHNETTSLDVMKVDLPPDAIFAVYLGLCCSSENKKAIQKQAGIAFPNAKIFEACRPRDKLALDFKEI